MGTITVVRRKNRQTQGGHYHSGEMEEQAEEGGHYHYHSGEMEAQADRGWALLQWSGLKLSETVRRLRPDGQVVTCPPPATYLRGRWSRVCLQPPSLGTGCHVSASSHLPEGQVVTCPPPEWETGGSLLALCSATTPEVSSFRQQPETHPLRP